ncbi:MAG: hypothetical protein WC915_01560 [archaeon]|jgi:hypothetical protein
MSKNITNVVAITIIDETSLINGKICDKSKILLGVRSNTNPIQPNVISSPTQRIPNSLAKELLNIKKKEVKFNSLPGYVDKTYFLFGKQHSQDKRGHDPGVFIINSLLSSKLGLAEDLEKGKILYDYLVCGLVNGKVFHHETCRPGEILDDKTNKKVEFHNMINLLVLIKQGSQFFPKKTAAYKKLIWEDIKTFKNKVENLTEEIDSYKNDFPIGGLCVASSYVTINKVEND